MTKGVMLCPAAAQHGGPGTKYHLPVPKPQCSGSRCPADREFPELEEESTTRPAPTASRCPGPCQAVKKIQPQVSVFCISPKKQVSSDVYMFPAQAKTSDWKVTVL